MVKQIVAIEHGLLDKKQLKKQNRLYAAATAARPDQQATTELLPTVSKFQGFKNSFFTFPIILPWHRATGWQLATANTFCANDNWDCDGPVIGIDVSSGRAFTFDPWELYLNGLVSSPNLLVQGSLRQGKSFFIKRLITHLTRFGKKAINPSDSKGEHGNLATALGGQVFKMGVHGSKTKINPLEPPERLVNESRINYQARVRAGRLNILSQLASLLNPGERTITSREIRVLEWALDKTTTSSILQPTITQIWQQLNSPDLLLAENGAFSKETARDLSDGIRRLIFGDLAGMFDSESTVNLDPDSPYTVIDTFELAQRGGQALAVTQAVTNHWINQTISNKAAGRKYFLIREEGWADMKTVAALEAHQRQLKLSGEFGIAMVLIVHEAGDFDAVGPEGSKERELARNLLKGYANKISFYQNQQTLIEAVTRGVFTSSEAAAIGQLARGQFLIKTHSNSYVVDGVPVTTDWERQVFDTDKQMRS